VLRTRNYHSVEQAIRTTSILVKLLTFEIHRLSCFHTMSSVDPLRCSRHRITYRITTFVKTFKYVRHLPHSPLTTKSCELRSSQTQLQCTTHTQQSSLFFCCYRTPLRSHETAQQAPSSPTAPAHHGPRHLPNQPLLRPSDKLPPVSRGHVQPQLWRRQR